MHKAGDRIIAGNDIEVGVALFHVLLQHLRKEGIVINQQNFAHHAILFNACLQTRQLYSISCGYARRE
jgi:hypothetical protein